MRKCYLFSALSLLVAVTLSPAADPPKPAVPKQAAPRPTVDWKEDSVCKMVFFAVLEGLYEDGVSTEAAASVVGRAKDGKAEIRRTFVFQCPLCHPVYEAFRAYQQRPAFRDKGDTFGKGIDAKSEAGLRSEYLLTRQRALQELVQRWVERRLNGMGLSPEQKSNWARRLKERSGEGNARLDQLKGTDAWYRLWGYGFCAACAGCEGACKILKAPQEK